MRSGRLASRLAAGALVLLAAATAAAETVRAETTWPAVTRESRPWTRWWWLGSAVDEAGLTRQLELLAAAGFGGVEICPIYGAKGWEDRYVPFLSPRWMELLAHTTREAQRLGLGVDLTTGTGWPFGGPWVGDEDASSSLVLERDERGATVPSAKRPIQKVKRAAPGGEGNVLDPYSVPALERYLAVLRRGVRGLRGAAAARALPRLVRVLRGELHAALVAGVRAARLRPARPSCRRSSATAPTPGGARAGRLPRDALRPAPRVRPPLDRVEPRAREPLAQPGPRRAGRPPRRLRRRGHTGDGGVRRSRTSADAAAQARLVGRARRRAAARLGRGLHLARRALPGPAGARRRPPTGCSSPASTTSSTTACRTRRRRRRGRAGSSTPR